MSKILQAAFQAAGRSKAKIARSAEITSETLRCYLKGLQRVPDHRRARLSAALGVPVDWAAYEAERAEASQDTGAEVPPPRPVPRPRPASEAPPPPAPAEAPKAPAAAPRRLTATPPKAKAPAPAPRPAAAPPRPPAPASAPRPARKPVSHLFGLIPIYDDEEGAAHGA